MDKAAKSARKSSQASLYDLFRQAAGQLSVPTLTPRDLEAKYNDFLMGRTMLRKEDFDAIISQLSGQPKPVYSMAIALLEHGRLAELDLLKEWLAGSWFSSLLESALHADKGSFTTAIAALDGCDTQIINRASFWILRAELSVLAHYPEAALQSLLKAATLRPSDDDIISRALSLAPERSDTFRLLKTLLAYPQSERHRWTAGLKAIAQDLPISKCPTSPGEQTRSERLNSNSSITGDAVNSGLRVTAPPQTPPLPEIAVVTSELMQIPNGDLLELDPRTAEQDLRAAQTPSQRERIAAATYRTLGDAGSWKSKLMWAGRYAFAKAARTRGQVDRSRYLITFLAVSEFCNSDEWLRNNALFELLKECGVNSTNYNLIQHAKNMLREPSDEQRMVALRLALALPHTLSVSSTLSSPERQRLAYALLGDDLFTGDILLAAASQLLGCVISRSETTLLTDVSAIVRSVPHYPRRDDKLIKIAELERLMEKSFASLPRELSQTLEFTASSLKTAAKDGALSSRLHARLSLQKLNSKNDVMRLPVRILNEDPSDVASARLRVAVEGHEAQVVNNLRFPERGKSSIIYIPIAHDVTGERIVDVMLDAVTIDGRRRLETRKTFVVKFGPALALEPIVNPYLTGKPIPPGGATFFGRRHELITLTNWLTNVDAPHVPMVYGQRRTGKTSLINQLELAPQLAKHYRFVFIDCEGAASADTYELCRYFVLEIVRKLGISLERVYDDARARLDPLPAFRDAIHEIARRFSSGRRLLLAIDEFSVLTDLIRRRRVSGDFLTVLRSLMQHASELTFLIAGSDDLYDDVRQYANPLFAMLKVLKMVYLDRDDLERLVLEPLKGQAQIDDSVLDILTTTTSGHPYMAQLLLNESVDILNEQSRRRLTSLDVHEAINRVLSINDFYFHELWFNRCAYIDRLVLSGLAHLMDNAHGTVVFESLHSLLANNGTSLKLKVIQSLSDRQILQYDAQERSCSFLLDLFRQWIHLKQPFISMEADH
jgi:hypothetical protein